MAHRVTDDGQRFTVALEKMASSWGQARQGNVIDFRHLHPIVFIGEEGHLNVEQWLIDTENLLVADGIPKTDRVDVVWIQLMGVAWKHT